MEFQRIFDAKSLLEKKSLFLFGPRSTGKTTLLERQLSELKRIDLLDPEVLADYSIRPKRLLEVDVGPERALVIDEIQKLPALLDVVQMAIQKQGTRFVLTGSSARRLKKQGVNLLGGRAWEAQLMPLSWKEIPNFDLLRYLNRGGLPGIYQSENWREEQRAYLSLYMKEEIIQEAATRDVPAFSRFLEAIGAISGQELVVDTLASDAGVKASTVRNYIDILKDTLLVFESQPFLGTSRRKAVSRSKLWVFDLGIARALTGQVIEAAALSGRAESWGRAFEHFLVREVQTYLSYRRSSLPLSYWRTLDQKEVDLVVPESFAAEIKAASHITDRQLNSLRALREEKKVPRYLVISQERERRKVDGIEIIPWQEFLEELWAGELMADEA